MKLHYMLSLLGLAAITLAQADDSDICKSQLSNVSGNLKITDCNWDRYEPLW